MAMTTAEKKKNKRMNDFMQKHQTYTREQAVTGQKENDSIINSFLGDSQNYIREADNALKRMNWKDATSSEKQTVSNTVAKNMMQRSNQVRSILESNKSSIDPDRYKMLTSYLDDFDDDVYAIESETENARKYFAQWKSEADYQDHINQQKDYAEKGKFDLTAGQKEIDDLEAERQKILDEKKSRNAGANGRPYAVGQQDAPDFDSYTTGYGITNNRPYAAGLQVQKEETPEDTRLREIDQLISKKKQYLKQAKRIQESEAYANTVKNVDFDRFDDYVKSDDALYNWINDEQFRDSYESNYVNPQHGSVGGSQNHNAQIPAPLKSEFARKGYDRMNANEIAIYNYYYAKSGKEAAQKYLDNIQETLERRVAEDMYGGIEDSTAAKIVFGAAVGLNQFGSNVENFFNTEDDYIAQTAYQLAGGMVREDLADEGKKIGLLGGVSLGQIAYDTVSTMANMAPSILASYAVGAAAGTLGLSAKTAQAVGSYTGSAMMGISAAGGAYQQALNEGFDKDQARGYGILVGASEVVMEKFLGGISAVGGNALGINAVKNIANADNALKAIAKRVGGSALSEFGEEYLQEVLDPVFSNIMLKTDKEVKPISAEAIYSGILGMLTGAIMESPSAIYGEAQTASTGRKLKEAGGVDSLAKIGSTFAADTVAYKLAGKVNENTGAYTIGQLLKEVDATLTEQNVSEIAEALMKEGVGEIAAKKYAQAFAYVVEGGAMPDSMVNAIEADTVLAKAAREVLIDSNTTWNQRTQGYNEVLRKLAMDKVTGKKSAKAAPANDQQMTGKLTAEESTVVENADESGAETAAAPKVSKIQTIEKGKTTVKLDDGTEVDLKDAALDPEDSVRIETIANVDGMSAEDASSIYSILKTAGGKSAQMDALGAKEAYQYGYYGLPESQLTEHAAFANSLTETQRKAVYEIGQKARQKKVENTTFKKSGAPKVAGKVHFDGDRSALNERQQVSLKTMDRIAEVLGVQIYVFESKVGMNRKRIGENGWYDPKDGSIHIDLYAGATGEATMLFTLAHELTHYIRQWSPQKFKVLADFLMEEYGKKGVRIESLIREQQAKAKRNGRTISYDTAYEEVVADSMEMMLSDGNVMKRLEKLKAQDKDLWSQIKRFVDNMAAKIREVYKGLKPDSKEAELVKEMGDTIYRLQELFTEGLVEASENFQSAEKNTTSDGGVKMQIREIGSTGRFYVQADRQVLTGDDSSLWGKQIENYINEQIRKEQDVAIPTSDGHVLLLTSRSAYKLKDNHVASIQKKVEAVLSDDAFSLKGRAATHIDELIQVARFKGYESDVNQKHENDIGEDGFNYFEAYFRDFDGKYYLIRFSAALNAQEETVYSIGQIRQRSFPADAGSSSKKEALKNGRKASSGIIYSSDSKSQELKTALQIAYERALNKKDNKAVEEMDVEIDDNTESVAPAVLKSERTWTESDYVQERDLAAKEIAKAIGVSEKKAKDYIDSVNSIAKMIADDRTRLDYFSSPNRSSFVSNVEYGGSFDFSTLCKKRRLLTGTFTAIQKALPNTALTANEILDIRNRMKDAGLEVSCGLCYVEGSRANMGQFAKEFLRLYKQYYPDAWQPNMADVNTPDGIEWVRINHPECYEQYEYFWNHYGTLKAGDKNLFASQQKPKLYQLHTEYKGEILKKFKDDDNVEEKNLNGGIRLQSFSDFEIVHLIDTMQIIMDMSRVGLAGQAYTKVPDFAWALGDTGLKINLSLIAKGVDENGKLIFDDVEGMPIKDAMNLRDRYSKNVGTILVAFNDEQLKAAMADERVDFIIPFHRSQWKKSQYKAMGLPAKTKDYTFMQNEKFIKPQYHEYRGRMVKDKATNYMPNEYWDFSKSGKENAEAYLQMCARNNKRPKFYKLLQNNGDGSYSLKADGSTDGYWKLLIDFKMYDNAGNGSPQMPVKPEFNMTEATRMLNDYSGGHSNFPVAQGIVDQFVSEYKDSHKGVLYSGRDFNDAANRAVEQFGTTKDFNEAGFILPDGKMIRLTDNRHKGERQYDHRAIGMAYGVDVDLSVNHGFNMESGKYLDDFVEHGGIRFDAGDPDLDMDIGLQLSSTVPLTKEQENIIRDLVEWKIDREEKFEANLTEENFLYRGPLAIRIDFGGNSNYAVGAVSKKDLSVWGKKSLEYNGREINANRIIADIRNYYRTGETKESSLISQFHYSDRDTESVSNRSLLANAMESLAQTELEKKKLTEYKATIDQINAEEQKLSDVRAQIKELSFAKGPRDKEKLRALRDEAIKLSHHIGIYDKQLLRLEASKPLQNVLDREKAKAYQRGKEKGEAALKEYKQKAMTEQEQMKKRYEESRKRSVENRNKTAMRHKIQNVVKELNSLLLTNDKKRHVPDNLKKAVAAALDLVNMDTVDAENRAAKYADLIAKEQAKVNPDQDKIYSYTMTMENILRQGEKMGQRIKELHAAYEEIQNSDDPDIANAYDPVIAGAIKELSATIGNTSIKNMTMDQLSDVYDVYRAVLTRVRDANKAMAENIRASIEELAKSTIREVQTVGGSKKYRVSNLDAVRKFDWNNMKPVYAMERIGSSTLTEVFDNVRAGEDTWAKDVSEAREYYLEKSKKYGYDKWDFDKKYRFESNSGIPFELTLEQILSLYAYSKREQAADHLRLGGFVFDSNIETYKEKDGKKSLLKYKVNTADAHQITPEIMADIIGKLSKEQTGFVDEMQDYLSTVMGAKGNEVTSKMYGVKLFKEKFYFPLKSAKQFMFEQNEVSGEVRIKNSGFTNKVVAKANNPVILSNFMDVWSGHVNDMSMYHAFTLPLEDFNRVFNYNSPKKDGVESVSVKGTIQDAYSPAAVSYVKQLITDLNGGARTDPRTGFINTATALHKKGAVLASLSVVIQQPSAIARATALIDLKYFDGYSAGTLPKVALDFAEQSLHDVFNLKKETNHDKEWAELKKYAPVAIIKEMGYFDANMGKSTQDYITGKEYSGFKEKVKATVTDSAYRDELLSKAPSLADEVAWCAIWRAVKRETFHRHNNLRPSSDALLKIAGERFTEVITKTQVYDSVLARSANMRSKDTGMNMATAFMAEPTTAINMWLDARLKGKRGNKIYKRRTQAAVLSSIILNSILVSIVYAGRDDDEDETYAEKYLGALTRALIDGINPAMYFPFIKDIWSIIQGYDVERSDMALANDLLKAWKKLSREDVSPYQKAQDFAGTAAMFLGFPLKNIMRDFRWIWQMLVDPILGNDSKTEKTTLAGIKYAQHHGRTGKDIPDKVQLYKARLDGDKQHAARVAARYDDEDSADAAVRAAIKDSFMADEIDEATAVKHMVLYAGMDGSEAHWTMDAWKYRKKVGSDEGYGKYGKFHDAVRSGKNLESVIKEYTDNGVKTSTLTGEITEEFKPVYLEASNSEKAAMKTKLISAYVACDMEREDAEKKLESWDFEAEYGFAYSDRKETYLSGNVSKATMVDILIDRGYDEEDAEAQIEAYEWEAAGFEDVTTSAIRSYNEWCEPVGIPKSVYLEFWRFDNSTENVVDKTTGKTIAYSAVKKIMAYINSLNLTDRQKDALAKSTGWSDKTIRKYKLW